MNDRLFPRNLPARRYARQVAGNPVTTRLESGVSNCFPGLEFDHRNLDRRFFPGLVFNFTDNGDPSDPVISARTGAHLVNGAELELADTAFSLPDGHPYADLAKALRAKLAAADELASGDWFLLRLKQGAATIDLYTETDGERIDLDGSVVWRLVRSLAPSPCTVVLERRPAPKAAPAAGGATVADAAASGSPASPPSPEPPAPTIELDGWRRDYLDPVSGVVDPVYGAGELSQSLCSPWQHDFRDCACNYWSSNHPDIVLAENPLGAGALPTGAAIDPTLDARYVDWLRRDRSAAGLGAAPGSVRGVRPFQLDHYEINARWNELAFVVGNRETAGIHRPPGTEQAAAYDNPDALAAALAVAATIEHVLALEYLYARYSVRAPDEIGAAEAPLAKVVQFVRHELLLVAVSEMRHLRWANQLLWSLSRSGLLKHPIALPALGVAASIPQGGGTPARRRALRPLTPEALDSFIRGEAPSGGIDGLYARVVTTLSYRHYPPGLREIASQIVADGVGHFSRFREMQVLLRPYADASAYLRPIHPGAGEDAGISEALALYGGMLADLAEAYRFGDAEDAHHIVDARQRMTTLDAAAEALARRGLGIPWF